MRQHFLYLLPLPHGQGSFRPVVVIAAGAYRKLSEDETLQLINLFRY